MNPPSLAVLKRPTLLRIHGADWAKALDLDIVKRDCEYARTKLGQRRSSVSWCGLLRLTLISAGQGGQATVFDNLIFAGPSVVFSAGFPIPTSLATGGLAFFCTGLQASKLALNAAPWLHPPVSKKKLSPGVRSSFRSQHQAISLSTPPVRF